MTAIVNDKTRKAADIKAEKRAAALRENLKKRKAQGRKDEGKRDEEPQDRE